MGLVWCQDVSACVCVCVCARASPCSSVVGTIIIQSILPQLCRPVLVFSYNRPESQTVKDRNDPSANIKSTTVNAHFLVCWYPGVAVKDS